MGCLTRFRTDILTLLLLATLKVDISASTTPEYESRLGSVHWSPCYYNRSDICVLQDGAEFDRNKLGSRVIKVALYNPTATFPWNCNWTLPYVASHAADPISTPLEVADTPQFDTFFQMGFDVVVLAVFTTVGQNYYLNGVSQQQFDDEYQQIKEVGEFLLRKYPVGKTFVIQNWEGDWAVRGEFNAAKEPSEVAVEGMKRWYEARQTAVTDARSIVTSEWNQQQSTTHDDLSRRRSSRIYHAAEINLVYQSMVETPGFNNTIVSVLPHIQIDFISYSAYDTFCSTTYFEDALIYINQHHNRTQAAEDYITEQAAYSDNDDSTTPLLPIYLGEYGNGVMNQPHLHVVHCVTNTIKGVLAQNISWAFWWETYNNQVHDADVCPGVICNPTCGPVFNESVMDGFWLMAPNGSTSWPFEHLSTLIRTSPTWDSPRDYTPYSSVPSTATASPGGGTSGSGTTPISATTSGSTAADTSTNGGTSATTGSGAGTGSNGGVTASLGSSTSGGGSPAAGGGAMGGGGDGGNSNGPNGAAGSSATSDDDNSGGRGGGQEGLSVVVGLGAASSSAGGCQSTCSTLIFIGLGVLLHVLLVVLWLLKKRYSSSSNKARGTDEEKTDGDFAKKKKTTAGGTAAVGDINPKHKKTVGTDDNVDGPTEEQV